MHLQALRYLVAVAEEGHFGRAAARMHVSQPSVSQAVARLERQFGTQLLDRTGARVTPTPTGERVLAEVRASLRHLDAAFVAARTPAPRLRVACAPLLTMWLTGAFLTPYRAARPDLDLTVAELDVPAQARALARGEVDACVGFPLRPDPAFTQTPIGDHPVALWMSTDHPLAALDEVPLARLAGHVVADADEDAHPSYGAWVRACLAGAGVEATFADPSPDTPTGLSRIIAGANVSLAGDILADGAIPGLAVRPVPDPVRWVWVATTTDGATAAAVEFVSWAAGRAFSAPSPATPRG